MRKQLIIVSGFVLFAALGMTSIPVSAQVKIKDSGDIIGKVKDNGIWEQRDPRWHREVKLKGHEGQQYLMRHIVVRTGVVTYGFIYRFFLDPSHKGERLKPYSSGLGMDEPVLQNWTYVGSFFDVVINGESMGDARAAFKIFGVGKEKGGLEVTWEDKKAVVTARFTAESQKVRLPVQVTISPKTEIQSLAIYLRCYPNQYARPLKKVRERHILTAKRNMEVLGTERMKVVRLAKDEPWIVYYDANFDKGITHVSADGKTKWTGSGPCALAYIPDETKEVTIKLGGYQIDTKLSYPPTTRKINLILWDFGWGKGSKNNQETIDYFKSLKIE